MLLIHLIPGIQGQGFEGISSDYEPNNGVCDATCSNWSQTQLVDDFKTYASLIHAAGLKSYAYPSGRGLTNGWDYSKLITESGCDAVFIETQTFVKNGATAS